MRHVPSASLRSAAIKRAAAIAVLVAVAIALSGCNFFRRDAAGYQLSADERPLEIPPDLDRPDTSAAMAVPSGEPQSVTRSSMTAPAAGAPAASAATVTAGFTVAGNREDTFNRVGEALATIQGVTIASRAQLLGAFDVNYGGSDFLVRVTEVEAGSYVSAVDPRGLPATGQAPVQLIAALQAALSP